MPMNNGFLTAAICAALLAVGAGAFAQEEDKPEQATPLQIVKVNSEEVLAILRSEELAGDENKAERRRQFNETVTDKFDWPAIAQHGLGVHWRNITDQQREEFTPLFRRLLLQVYFRRLNLHAVDAKVTYVKEEVEDDRATVYTVAEKNGVETPIDYLMRRQELKEGEEGLPWLIYDVKVEGVILLLNYREQFNEIVVSSGFDQLMSRLKKKVEKGDGE